MTHPSHRLFRNARLGLLLGVALASAAFAAGDPVRSIASQRFEFTNDAHRFVVPYEATHPLDEKHESITRLVIMVHGILRNPDLYHPMTVRAHRLAGEPEHVAIISPQFLTGPDILAHELGEHKPYWTRGGWAAGHNSRNDRRLPRPARVSSYAVLDQMLLRAAEQYPSLEKVVVAGHSAGGQFVNRYAAGNRVHQTLAGRGIEVSYIVSNPSSYLYFCDHRPMSHDPIRFASIGETPYADCAEFNRYRYGLENLNQYMREAGSARLGQRYAARPVTYLLGAADNDPESRFLARGCAAMAQGAHRLQRGIAYYHYLGFRFGDEVYQRHRKVIVPGVGHSSRGVYASREGRTLLFGPPRSDENEANGGADRGAEKTPSAALR